MLIEYVGHHDEVEIDGYGLVKPGEPVDVPDALAGRAPVGHRADKDFDPGEGLLAQPANWQVGGASANQGKDDGTGDGGGDDGLDGQAGQQGPEVVDDPPAGTTVTPVDLSKPPETPPSDTPPSATPEEK